MKVNKTITMMASAAALFGGVVYTTTNASAAQKPVVKVQMSAKISDAKAAKINSAFYKWSNGHAKKQRMAVSNWFFDHGAAGRGDWYAKTPDGEVQVQNLNNPGKAAFKLHALGGVVFYTAKNGKVGQQNLQNGASLAQNYAKNANMKKPMKKYILGDNGVVYELNSNSVNPMGVSTGFGEYTNNGKKNNYITPTGRFKVSNDAAAQAKLKQLIKQYH